jgi:predicted secreted protein
MKFKLAFLSLFLGAAIFTSSCCCKKKTKDSTSTTEISSSSVKITAADNGKTFHVKANEKFEATFNECVGCAQVWKITTIDKEKITVGENTYSNRSCTDCTGGTRDNTFHLQANAAGKSELTFSYFDQKIAVTIETE